jgi:RecB family exonuclease
MGSLPSVLWSVFVSPQRKTLQERLEEAVAGAPPGSCVVVVRSSDEERHLARRFGPGVVVTPLARFLGRGGPEGIEEEDLLPQVVLQWLVEQTLPEGYRDAARQHLASVFLDAVHLLEENAIRPPYPGKARQEGEWHLERAHRALLEGLKRHHAAGRFAPFERVSLSREGPSRLRVAFPALERILFFGIDSLSRAEQQALENLLGQETDVGVEWFVLGGAPSPSSHPALGFTAPLLDWLRGRGEVRRSADDSERGRLLEGLYSLKPSPRVPLSGVLLDTRRASDDASQASGPGAPVDRTEEVRRLLQRVRALLDAGTEASRVAVVVPALQDYADLLQDAFKEHGVPLALSYRGSLRSCPPGSLVGGVLDALDSALVRDAVLDVLAHPLCGFWVTQKKGSRVRLDARWARLALQEAGLNPRRVEGAGGWREAIERLRRRNERKKARASHKPETDREDDGSDFFAVQMEGLMRFVERLEALGASASPQAFLAGLRDFLDEVGVRDRMHAAARDSADPEWSLAGYRGVVALLDEAEDAFHLEPGAGASSRLVRDVLRRSLITKEVPIATDPAHGVQVMAWRGARFGSYDHVFVIGAVQGALPERDEAGAVEEILGDRFQKELVRLDRASEARRIMHQLLVDTQKSVVFSVPQSEKDAPLVRSVLLDELEERFELQPAPAVGEASYTMREAARLSVLQDRPLAAPVKRLEAAWALMRERVHEVGDGAFTGRMLDEQVRLLPAARPVRSGQAVSAGRLTQFAKCPFRSLVTKGMRVQAPRERDEELDRLDKGDILHAILERYVRAAIQQEGTPLRITRGLRGVHEALLLQHALDVVEENRRRSLAFRAYEESLLGGLPGASNPYAGAPRGLLVRFLDQMEAFEPGEGVVGVELGFTDMDKAMLGDADALSSIRQEHQDAEEDLLEVETSQGAVRIRGRIDRLDLVMRADGPGLRVVEYKSGSVPDKRLVEGGVEFQLPLYAWVAGLLFDGYKVEEAAYHQLKRPRQDEAGIVSNLRYARGEKNDLEALVAKTPRRVEEILAAQEAGRFPLTILDEKEAGCEWCELRRGCGLRPEVTALRRERARMLKGEGPAVSGYVPDRVELAGPQDGQDEADEPDREGAS